MVRCLSCAATALLAASAAGYSTTLPMQGVRSGESCHRQSCVTASDCARLVADASSHLASYARVVCPFPAAAARPAATWVQQQLQGELEQQQQQQR